ncbi:hypothetical protein BV25DRAFT_1825373 [Artomyces pyxidatus]|uniref:Uncharacterized protein n=1 Tax=Artomyces pyxidatus TaxID=48021 RepID=A0ACB8T352_9AGAM|nr:hypothetical protein BV25DRAFT_1825373 [Artomyces pyxidatus]
MLFLPLLLYALLAQPGGSSPVASPTTATNTTIPFAALAGSSDVCDSISNCRTLYNIVWSSLVTILACVWTAVHRNISAPAKAGESRAWHVVARVLEVVKIVVVTLLVPEWVLAWAVRQSLHARDVGRELEAARAQAQGVWKERGLVSGKKVVRGSTDSGEVGEDVPLADWRAEQEESLSILARDEYHVGRLRGKWTTRHGFFVVMGGFHIYEDGEPMHPLSRYAVLELVKTGDLMPPTAEELQGWSHGDTLSKTLAVTQTLWFVIQCIARRVEHLPITQLEVMTLAYTTITVAMYVAWWDKPQNVGCPLRVPVKRQTKPEYVEKVGWYDHIIFTITGGLDLLVDLNKQQRVPTFYGGSTRGDHNDAYADMTALVVAMVFGAVHCAAWDYAFPSGAEERIWRISSVCLVAVPGAMLLIIASFWRMTNIRERFEFVVMLFFFVCVPVYIAARILLLVLSFTSLRSLPYDAYQTVQWTLRIPHVT